MLKITVRDKSKIFVYEIDNPEMTLNQPFAIIERNGDEKRTTAGCVAITEIDKSVLVIVGDWDTEHLDFYRMNKDSIYSTNSEFELIYSITIEDINKSNWIDKIWLAYQNINFIKDYDDNLYLVGMALNENKQNTLDLFKIETDDYNSFGLKKIKSKVFNKKSNCNLNWGAGIYYSNNEIMVLSCDADINAETNILIFK